MSYNQFTHNTNRQWSLADGGGGTHLGPDNAKQTPGNPMLLSLDPKGAPYMDAYWYLQLGQQNVTQIDYTMDVTFPTKQDYDRSEAIENETDYILNGWHYDTGIQADFAKGIWRTYDLTVGKGAWIDTKVALPGVQKWLSGFEFVSVCTVKQPSPVLGTLLSSPGVTYEGLWVDGTWFPLGVFAKAVRKNADNHLNMACQLDGQKVGLAYSIYVSVADVRVR